MKRPLAVLLVGATWLAPSAHSEVSIRERIDLQNRKLREVKTRSETVDRRLQALGHQVGNLERKLDESRRDQADLERQISKLRAEVDRATKDADEAHRLLEEAKWEHENYAESYAQRLVHIYKRSALSPIGLMLESQSFDEVVRRSRYMRFLKEDAGRLYVLEEGRDRVANRARQLDEARHRATDLRQRLVQREKELTRNILEQSRLLDQIRREREHEREKKQRLSEAQKLLRKKLANLQDAARVVEDRQGTGAPSREAPRRGRLRWPLDDEPTILKPFGRTTNEAGTPEFNSGIDLLVTQPRNVRAAAVGRVLFQGIFSPAYGKVVMIDHGGSPVKIISLYGNLDSILVEPNQELRDGDVIGTVGDAASSDRASHLKFEIRKGTDPENPLHWLSRR
jgi:septal ring factor EnvC (AmiA/AmiB activator)